jgi:hypothetical protein
MCRYIHRLTNEYIWGKQHFSQFCTSVLGLPRVAQYSLRTLFPHMNMCRSSPLISCPSPFMPAVRTDAVQPACRPACPCSTVARPSRPPSGPLVLDRRPLFPDAGQPLQYDHKAAVIVLVPSRPQHCLAPCPRRRPRLIDLQRLQPDPHWPLLKILFYF